MRYRFQVDALTGGMLHAAPPARVGNIIPLQRNTYLLGGDVQYVTGQNIVARTTGLRGGGPRVVRGYIPLDEALDRPIWNPFLWSRR